MGYTLVTGATSDIGKEICKTLAQEGQALLLSDINEEMLSELRLLLEGEDHLLLPLDLSMVEESKQKLEDFIKNSGIAINHAVFLAGIFSVKPIKILTYDFVKKNFDIAVFSIIFISQVLTSKKINGNNLKSAVVISSVSAIIGTKGYLTYSAVKASMLGLIKSMAVELAPTVRINAIMPGGIHTRATNFIYENQESISPRYLLGEGYPLDIAHAISFFLSDNSRWITGQSIIIDGGLSIS